MTSLHWRTRTRVTLRASMRPYTATVLGFHKVRCCMCGHARASKDSILP